MVLPSDQLRAYLKFAARVVTAAGLEWEQRFPGEGSLGFTRAELHRAIYGRAIASGLVNVVGPDGTVDPEERCAAAFAAEPQVVRGWALQVVARAIRERLGRTV